MRYMTPDTPSTRSLESPSKKGRMIKVEEALEKSKMETTTPAATPTPTPSPTKIPSTAATEVRKPARRAIRTYGKKRTLPDETNEPQSKRHKAASATMLPPAPVLAAPAATQHTRRDSVSDEVSRQIQKEAEEAERRNNMRPQTPTNTIPSLKTTTPRKVATPPRKAISPRRVGIMRYFQPAARSAPQPPPPTLPEPCSPALSISSMSSLSSCPSPVSSIGSFRSRESSVVSSTSAKSTYSADDTAFTTNEAGSPPSSPIWKAFDQRPRQKRRLTIRPDQQMAATKEDNETTSAHDQKQVDTEEADDEAKENIPLTTSATSSMMAASSSKMRLRLGLSALGANITTKKRKKTGGPATVQTTLSLAVAPRNGGSSDSASVRECKECNILYNPLHEKDAKFHARYHASVCRKQQQKQQEEKDQEREQLSASAAVAGVRLR